MALSRKLDMTRGSILPLAFRFALPLCLSNLLQQMYTTVDTLIIGNYCGPLSLAAVGTSSQPVELVLNLVMGVGSGVSILVAQFVGAGEKSRLQALLSTSVSFLFLSGVPLTILGVLLGPVILSGMQVPSEVFPLAQSYLHILFLSTLGNLGYNMNASILRGMGDSRSSLLFLIVSCVINIVLDLLFVAVMGMDVAGAALATAISILSSWFASIFYIRRKYPELAFSILPRRMQMDMLKELTRIGIPLGINNSFYSVGHLLMQTLINMQGAAFAAACSIATKLTGIANVAISAMSSAGTTFAGQNLGACKYRRLLSGSWRIPLMSAVISLTSGLLMAFFSRFLLGFFTSDPTVLQMAQRYIQVVMPFMWFYALFNGIISFINGIGEMRYPMVVNVLMLWAIRIPVGHLIARYVDGTLIMAAFPISFLFGLLCMLAYFRTRRWCEIRSMAAAERILSV